MGVRVEVTGGNPRWPEAIEAALRAASRAEGVWTIAAEAYPAPSCLAELADAGFRPARTREIPIPSREALSTLSSGGEGEVRVATRAVTYSPGCGFDEDGTARELSPGGVHPVGERPFATVIVRTRGDRPANFEEALTCLAAQWDADFDVVVAANGCPSEPVRALVESFAPAFAERVRVIETEGGSRSRPLNAGLDAADGRYLAFLDDDDLVTADWMWAFHGAVGSGDDTVLRSGSVVQPVRRLAGGSYEMLGTPFCEFGGPEFDLVDHLVDNRSPIFSWAVPLETVRERGFRFDESLPVLEDWDFLMHCALAVPVRPTGRITGLYHRWETGESALDEHGIEEWATTRDRVHQRLDELVGTPGLVTRLAALESQATQDRAEVEELRARLARAAARARPEPLRQRLLRLLRLRAV